MFCPNCGKETEDGIAFCGSCGKRIQEAAPAAQAAPAAEPAVQASAAETAKVAAGAVTGVIKANPKMFAIIGGAVVVVIAALIVAVMMVTGGFTDGQTSGTFRAAFEEQEVHAYNVPSTSFVGESPYELKSCDVTDVAKQSNGQVTANVKAVAENDDFKVTTQYAAVYLSSASLSRTAGTSVGAYAFDLMSKEVEAKHGVTHDDQAGFSDVETELSEDGRSCEYVNDATYQFWFADSSLSSTNRYELTDNGWKKVSGSGDTTHTVAYKDINGSYAAKKGDMLSFGSFTISDLNAQTGSFNIRIDVPQEVNGSNTYSPVTAALSATIDPERKSGTGSLEDGYQYAFEAKGATTAGKKTASFTGYFTTDDSGAPAIEVTSGSLDRSYVNRFDSQYDSSMSFSGTLYKQ